MEKLQIKDCQNIELGILIKVDELCKKLVLRYYLIYGTLLGAVRHQGFIPWDDDLDIMMPRPDYKVLIDYFEAHKRDLFPFKAIYAWHDYKYSYGMTRITNMNYKLKYTQGCPFSTEDMGLFIDVYPYDGLGNDIKTAQAISKNSLKAERWIGRSYNSYYTTTESTLKKMVQPFIYKYAHFIGEDHYQKKMMKISNSFNYDSSRFVGPLTWHESCGCFEKNFFEPYVNVNFCDRLFRAPHQFDKLLKLGYGDYMKLPPENERTPSHFYEAYVRSEHEKQSND